MNGKTVIDQQSSFIPRDEKRKHIEDSMENKGIHKKQK
jgi:hypothetical protein